MVEIAGLSKRFSSEVLAVDDLSFTVERGQVVGLLGPNGAGKTTCLRMLLGLIRPSAGEAKLFGTTVKPGAHELRRVGALIESAGRTVVLADHTKWHTTGLRVFATFADVDVLVTDAGLAEDARARVQDLVEQLVVA